MSTQVSRRVTSRALEQRDMASLRVTEVWADVVISFLAPSAPSILFETPVKLAFVHAIDACNETIDDTAENDSYWTRGASIRDVTLTDIADAIAAPVEGTWRTYLDLVPFKDFVTDLRIYLTRVHCKRGKEGNDPARLYNGIRFYNMDCAIYYPSDLTFKGAQSMFVDLNTTEKLPIRDVYDTEYAFNEFYYLISTIASEDARDKALLVTSGSKTSLFGVPIHPCVFASRFLCSSPAESVLTGCRQYAEVRAWIMRQLFPPGPPVAPGASGTSGPSVASGASGLSIAVSLPPGLPSAFWHDFVGRLSRLSRVRDSSKKRRVGVYLARIVETVVKEKEKEVIEEKDPKYAEWLAATSTEPASPTSMPRSSRPAAIAPEPREVRCRSNVPMFQCSNVP